MQMNATILYTSIYEKRKEKGGDGCRFIKMNWLLSEPIHLRFNLKEEEEKEEVVVARFVN